MSSSQRARAMAGRLPTGPGVYRFRDGRGRVMYVGRAVNLRRRVQSYWGDLGDRVHLRRMVAAIVRIEALPCDSPHEAAWLERNLIEGSRPRWNRAPSGGAESEVWILLDDSERTPGLTLVHRDGEGRCYGPYLGGTKVRDALAGLGRILPLAYTSEAATGSERDMARLRGAGPAQRPELTARLAAVLDRDRTAVAAATAALESRRDAAAAQLGFESAARIQAELVGLSWISGTQRVTRPGTPDVDVAGFCDGTLVTFEIRDGRLCRWHAPRPASTTTGRRRCASTPPEWVDFANGAARLAARLAAD